MAGKGKKGSKKQAQTTVAAAPVTQDVVDVTDTASDTSSVEGTVEPSAEAPVEETTPVVEAAVETEEVAETPAVEEPVVAAPLVEATTPVVEEPVAVAEPVVVDEAPKSRGLSLEERVLTDTTPRSPRHDVLAVADTTKMWFLHPSFYYQKTKDVYAYTTSFRGVAPLAAVGETSVNYVLQHLQWKQVATLGDVDSNLAPALATIDEQLDERVAGVLQTLVEGQDYLLAKKNEVVGRAKEVQTATLDKVTELTTALDKKTSSALDSVAKAKAATLETVTSTAHLVLSYVPILNKKVMA